jgi:hypothetical protein
MKKENDQNINKLKIKINLFSILVFDQRKQQMKDTKPQIFLVFSFLETSTI